MIRTDNTGIYNRRVDRGDNTEPTTEEPTTEEPTAEPQSEAGSNTHLGALPLPMVLYCDGGGRQILNILCL